MRGSTLEVSWSFGKFFSHRHVDLEASCPNIHGWMIWSGFLMWVDRIPTGFSTAMRGIGASQRGLDEGDGFLLLGLLVLEPAGP